MRAEILVVSGALLIGWAPVARLRAEPAVENLARELSALREEVEKLSGDLEMRKEEMRGSLRSLVERKAELEQQAQKEDLRRRRMEQSRSELQSRTEARDRNTAALKPLIDETIGRLRTAVEAGLPFRTSDRLAELERIREKADSGALSVPDALAQLWSFTEDELRMTGESGLFRQTIILEGDTLLVDVARLGMAMLFFRSDDGRTGYAARSGTDWEYRIFADERSRREIEALFDSFKKQIRVGFFTLPNALAGEVRP